MQSTEVIEVIVPEPPMGCSLALSDRAERAPVAQGAVSYTHLTLPTICSV